MMTFTKKNLGSDKDVWKFINVKRIFQYQSTGIRKLFSFFSHVCDFTSSLKITSSTIRVVFLIDFDTLSSGKYSNENNTYNIWVLSKRTRKITDVPRKWKMFSDSSTLILKDLFHMYEFAHVLVTSEIFLCKGHHNLMYGVIERLLVFKYPDFTIWVRIWFVPVNPHLSQPIGCVFI